MTLQKFLDTGSHDDRVELEEIWQWAAEVLDDAGLGHVQETIKNECRLPVSVWDELLAALNETTEGSVPEVMTQVFRNWTLCGPNISKEAPIPQGRALEVSRFRSLMLQAGMSPSRRDQIVEDVQRGLTPAVPYSEQLSDCDLGNHLIWSTFSEEEEDSNDPFRSWTGADTVRDRLGLRDLQHSDDPEERGLVLLVYRIPSPVSVKYPTIAEAYAGPGWNPNFQCSDRGDDWGYTSGGRPEVVHEVIQGKRFVQDPSNSPYAFAPLRIVN